MDEDPFEKEMCHRFVNDTSETQVRNSPSERYDKLQVDQSEEWFLFQVKPIQTDKDLHL